MQNDLINGRTPEEIKRWVDGRATCNTCPKEHEVGCEYGERTEDCQMSIDTIAYIERLESERDAALAKVPKWISVEERLPEVSFQTNRLEYTDPVFAVDDVGDLCIGRFEISKYDGKAVFYGYTADSEEYDPLIVTRWLDNVPEPPKGDA